MIEGLTDCGRPENQLEVLSELVINASVQSEELRHIHELVEQINRGLALVESVRESRRKIHPFDNQEAASLVTAGRAVGSWRVGGREVRLEVGRGP